MKRDEVAKEGRVGKAHGASVGQRGGCRRSKKGQTLWQRGVQKSLRTVTWHRHTCNRVSLQSNSVMS